MLTIVGGTYTENCLHPDWRRVYGSGLRAAIAVSTLAENGVHLHTCAASSEQKRLLSLQRQNEITISVKPREHPIEFQYYHSGASPRLFPDFRDIRFADQFEVRASQEGDALESVLGFSFIELPEPHLPTFNGRRVVYDPQAGDRALPFLSTGSKAKELVICLNFREAKAIARRLGVGRLSSPDAIANAICRKEGARAVIIKNQIFGAHIVTEGNGRKTIPAYKTPDFFGIGSGDVFSAVFAALWGDREMDIFDAAEWASVATAFHCKEKGALPIPDDLDSLKEGLEPIDVRRIKRNGLAKRSGVKSVYLAGPFFNLSQRWLINQAYHALTALGLTVWSPSAEAGILPPRAKIEKIRSVVEQDLKQLDTCGTVFALVDGMDPGTLFEIGYAAARKSVPIVAFSQSAAEGDLTMLLGSDCCRVCNDFASAIYAAAWEAFRL